MIGKCFFLSGPRERERGRERRESDFFLPSIHFSFLFLFPRTPPPANALVASLLARGSTRRFEDRGERVRQIEASPPERLDGWDVQKKPAAESIAAVLRLLVVKPLKKKRKKRPFFPFLGGE